MYLGRDKTPGVLNPQAKKMTRCPQIVMPAKAGIHDFS
jgi:hypothetical protein